MAEPAPDRSPDDAAAGGIPRWVKVLGVLVLLLILVVAVLHLTGNSAGGPGSHLGSTAPRQLP